MNSCNCDDGTVVAPNYNKAHGCVTPPTQLRTVTIPAKQGGDGEHDPYAPKLGAWQNTIVIYKKTGGVWLFDVNGVPTCLTGTDYAATILELQEQVEKNSKNIEDLDTRLTDAISERIASDEDLQKLIENLSKSLADETAARKTADSELQEQLQSTQQQLNDVATKVDGAESDLSQAVENLESKITAEQTAREQGDANLQSQVTQNTADIAALKEGEAGGGAAFAKEVVLDLETAEATTNQVVLTATMGNLGTDITSAKDIILPTATETQAGVFSANDFARIVNLETEVGNVSAALTRLDTGAGV